MNNLSMLEDKELYRRKKIGEGGYIAEELWEKEYNRTGEVTNNRLVMDSEVLEHFDDKVRRKDEAMNKILEKIEENQRKGEEVIKKLLKTQK